MRGNPNETFESLNQTAIFALSGDLATFYVPTTETDEVTVFAEVLNDHLQPLDGEVAKTSDDGTTVLTVKIRNTQHVDQINAALTRVSEHFGLPEVIWTSGAAHVARRSPVGVSA